MDCTCMECVFIIWSSLYAMASSKNFENYSRTDVIFRCHLPTQIRIINTVHYNNNGKPNPNNVVLYLYTTYDNNFFSPISSISCPMILVHPREFHDV